MKLAGIVLLTLWLLLGCASVPLNAECDAQAQAGLAEAQAAYERTAGAQALAIASGFSGPWVQIFSTRPGAPERQKFYRACLMERGLSNVS